MICWVRDPGLPLWAAFAECTLSENHVVLYDWVGDLLAKKNTRETRMLNQAHGDVDHVFILL